MNYFELYPGDYLRDTTRLSLVEHGAYLRLMLTYYAEESPLPADPAELYVIAGASSAADKAAVRKVADRFFPIGPDGKRHNARADAEIAKFGERAIGADEKRSNEAERQRRTRERRMQMFAELREVGIVPDAMATMAELRDLHTAHVTRDYTVMSRVTYRDMSRHVTSVNTATTSHKPQANNYVGSTEASPQVATRVPTEEGRACLLMRQRGCAHTNPSHPDLRAAIQEGVTPEALADTAAEAISAGKTKPFAWAITTARSRHAEGAMAISTGPPRQVYGHTAPPMSKTLQALHELEAAKNGTGLDHPGDQLRIAEADPAQP